MNVFVIGNRSTINIDVPPFFQFSNKLRVLHPHFLKSKRKILLRADLISCKEKREMIRTNFLVGFQLTNKVFSPVRGDKSTIQPSLNTIITHSLIAPSELNAMEVHIH